MEWEKCRWCIVQGVRIHGLMHFHATQLLLLATVTKPNPEQVSQVTSMDISQLLKVAPQQTSDLSQGEFSQEQRKDPDLRRMIQFLETGNLPGDVSQLQKIAAQALQFSVVDGILYFMNGKKPNKKQAVVPV